MVRFVFLTYLFVFPFTCHAQEESPYQLKLKGDLITLGAGAALSAGGIYLQGQTKPLTEAEIALLLPENVIRFDRSATRRLLADHATASNYLAAAAVISPLALLPDKAARNDYLVIGVMFVEVGLLTNGLTTMSKGSFNRIRPYVYNLDVPIQEKTSRDARHSFFSGHVSNTAAFSFFTAQLVNSYSNSRLVKAGAWGAAITLPAVTGIFRYTSGKHYPTDIITGYVVGGAIGYLVPHFHKTGPKKELSQLYVYPTDYGFGLVYRF